MSTPATRSLPAVLRALTAPQTGVQLLVGTWGPGPADVTYAPVLLDGQPLTLPKLAGVTGSEGQPAYILAAPGRMIVIGTVTN